MFSIYLLILSISNATKHVRVIGQCTDPYRGCIVSTMVLGDWELSNVACDSISVFLSHICGRTKRWPSILNLRGHSPIRARLTIITFLFLFFFLYTYIYKSYFYRVEKCGCRYKMAPQSESRRRKEKKGKRDGAKNIRCVVRTNRRAVSIPAAWETGAFPS